MSAPYPVPAGRELEAACAGAPTDVFFPISMDGRGGRRTADLARTRTQEAQAKELCSRCPFVVPCLQYALDRSWIAGVWGGTNEGERRVLRRKMPRAPIRKPVEHGTEAGYRMHRRRGEDACGGCLEANARAQARRRPSGAA